MRQEHETHNDWHLEQLINDVQRRVTGGADAELRPHVRTLPRDDTRTASRSTLAGILSTLTTDNTAR